SASPTIPHPGSLLALADCRARLAISSLPTPSLSVDFHAAFRPFGQRSGAIPGAPIRRGRFRVLFPPPPPHPLPPPPPPHSPPSRGSLLRSPRRRRRYPAGKPQRSPRPASAFSILLPPLPMSHSSNRLPPLVTQNKDLRSKMSQNVAECRT